MTHSPSHKCLTSDSESFIQAQIPEIRGLESMQVFEYHKLHDLPPAACLLSSIWSYHRKRHRTLLKYKSRICVDGSQQLYGQDYWDMYAPIIAWSTIWLILLLTTIMNFQSRQVNYMQAFPQAELTDSYSNINTHTSMTRLITSNCATTYMVTNKWQGIGTTI